MRSVMLSAVVGLMLAIAWPVQPVQAAAPLGAHAATDLPSQADKAIKKAKQKAKQKAKAAAPKKATTKPRNKATSRKAAAVPAAPVDPFAPADPYPKAAAAYAVAVDDQLIYGRQLDTPRPPASLTKLLSALVVLDHPWDADAPVQISDHAAGMTGARIGLRRGDVVRAGDLLTGMIVRSGNDACMAMAEHIGGSEEGFVRLMNQKAQAIGMTASSFRNPCGLDADGHLSTARDLLTLARMADRQAEISWRANAKQADFRVLNTKRRISFRNTNAMLGTEPQTVGMKTGFTNKAGKCLIALAEHGAHKVWVVLLHSPNRWGTAKQMLARGATHVERPAAALAHP